MDILRKIFFLKDLSTGELIKVNILSEKEDFKEGEEIVKEGEPCEAVYIIKEGSVRVMKGNTHIETLGPGEPIGEIAFIDKGERSATLVAHSDTSLIKIPADHLEKVLSMDKELAFKIHRSILVFLSKRLREANEALKIIPDYIKDSYDNL
jgi:CRP-like cAMP-binding protein